MSLKADSERAELHAALLELLPRMRRFARGLTGNAADADDLLQATVERALTRSRPDGTELHKWMFRVCRNLWIDELRARGVRRDAVPRLADTDAQVVGEGALFGHLGLEEAGEAMRALSPEQREVLMLVAVEGLTYREAAELLEVPAGTVMSRLSRARAALLQRLGEAE